jgi:hypothetical protein
MKPLYDVAFSARACSRNLAVALLGCVASLTGCIDDPDTLEGVTLELRNDPALPVTIVPGTKLEPGSIEMPVGIAVLVRFHPLGRQGVFKHGLVVGSDDRAGAEMIAVGDPSFGVHPDHGGSPEALDFLVYGQKEKLTTFHVLAAKAEKDEEKDEGEVCIAVHVTARP